MLPELLRDPGLVFRGRPKRVLPVLQEPGREACPVGILEKLWSERLGWEDEIELRSQDQRFWLSMTRLRLAAEVLH